MKYHTKDENIIINPEVKSSFPDLQVLVKSIENVSVKKGDPYLEAFKNKVIQETKGSYSLEKLKDEPILRAYRDFFWRIKVDPTKNRPAAEALIRRVVSGKPLPQINTLVDAYNLASIKTEISIAAFDSDSLHGKLLMRFSREGEKFLGIGMKKPVLLHRGEIVIEDEEKLIAIYPYRDAEDSKITIATRNVLLLFCGVPGIRYKKLSDACEVTSEYIMRFCNQVTRNTNIKES